MKKSFLAMGLASFFFFTGCKKEDTKPKTTLPTFSGSASTKNSQAESAYTEMPNISNQAMSGALVYYKSGKVIINTLGKESASVLEKAACNVVITIDTVGTPDTLIVDWGTANCTCNDGKTRRGKIITTWTGSYYDQGTVITHTPDGYYVNDNKVEGNMTVENMGNNSSGQPYFNIDINGLVTFTSGEVVTYTSTRVRTFTNGYTTQLYFMDDEYDVDGTANASSSDGDGWTTDVTSPLHVKVGCPFITKGVLDLTPVNLPTRTVDYGNGDCDASFTVTINGQTYTFNL